MIRINLLPGKERALIQWGQRQLLLYVAAILATLLGCFFYARSLPDPKKKLKILLAKKKRFEEKRDIVAAEETCDQDRIRRSTRKANKKRKAVERLLGSRTTPKYVLRELSRVLSESYGPTYTRRGATDRKPFNPNWDPGAVWITVYEEQGRQVRIEGGAKGEDDIAEFWRRLQVSDYFFKVDLEKFSKVASSDKKKAFLQFSINAGANY